MQDRMATKSAALNRMYQRFFVVWVPAFGWCVRHLPLGILYAMGRAVMSVFLAVRPKYERGPRSNFAQILSEPDGAPSVRALARRMAMNHARYWIDFFYWSERGADAARTAIREVANLAALERCVAEGRGVVALTAHIGNWEMGGLLLGGRAGEVAVVYVPDRFEMIEAYRSRYRRSAGVREIPLTDDPLSALAALRVLRAGGVVAVQGDRDFDGSGVPFPFFGRTAYFPRGPAVLSLLSRAPILPVFILRGEDTDGPGSGGFRVVVLDPIEPEGDPRDEEAVLAILRRTVSAIERMVREHPEQWYCFYPFWDDPTRASRSRRSSPRERTRPATTLAEDRDVGEVRGREAAAVPHADESGSMG